MKKFLLMLITLVLISGCSSQNENNEVNKNYNSDAKYNFINNDNSSLLFMADTEDSIVCLSFVNTEKGAGFIPMYVSENKLNVLTLDASSTCSNADPSKCEGLYYGMNPIMYYKGYLYNFNDNYQSETNSLESVIERRTLDGKNQQVVYTFEKENLSQNGTIYATYADYMQFHRDKIYVQKSGRLYIGELGSKELKNKTYEGVKSIGRIYFVDDTMYLCTDEYDTGEEVLYNVIFKCNLDGEIEELLYTNIKVVAISDKYIVSEEPNEEEQYATYFLIDKDTNEKKELIKSSSSYILQHENGIIIEGDVSGNKMIFVFDANGNLVAQKDCTNDNRGFPQIYTGDRLYVSDLSQTGYYEITEEGISDLVMLEVSKE